ncbi:MAG TPA: hypothetical protein VEU62_00090 [Bryobacterales bacterium]|nr:hypothetical protein [Bryobacterales bacterium]
MRRTLRSVALLLILSTVLLVSRGFECATACSLRQCAPHKHSACPHSPAPGPSRDPHPPCTQHHSLHASWVPAPRVAVTADFPSSLPAPPPLRALFTRAHAVVLPAPLDTGPPHLVPAALLRI